MPFTPTPFPSEDPGNQTPQSSAISLAWSSITGRPTTFPPSAHRHAISEVDNLQTALDGKQTASQVSSAISSAISRLGLGTASTHAASDFDAAGSANAALVSAQNFAIGQASSVQASLNSHESDRANPHAVTKAQVGLGNVNNTSDLNKPVSTAVQTALDGKQPAGNYATLVNGTVPASQLPVTALFPLGSSAYPSGEQYPATWTIKTGDTVIGYVHLTYDSSNRVTAVSATDASGTELTHGNYTVAYDSNGNPSVVCTN